jgi:anaerobic selenocysteine-containing dehydrogenase
MDRRSFIKLTAVTGGSAALAGCGHPEHQLVRFLPAEDIVPGAAVWKPSVCPLCASGCGLTVRVMDADADVVRNGQAGVVRILAAKKLEGSPAYPVNQGGLCARGQAAIQVTYHPDRIVQPLKRVGERGDGRYEAVSWDAAIGEVVARLDALQSSGRQKLLGCVSRRWTGHRAAVMAHFLRRFGAPAPVAYELFSDDVIRRANLLSFGREQLPTFDLASARAVVSFGADFLGTWNSPVSQAAAYGAMRQGRPGIRGTFIQVESRMSQTGANADQWVPIRPGTDGALALGLAHAIMAAKLVPVRAGRRAAALIDGWSAGLPAYTPAEVEKTTGVAASRVERLARGLVDRLPAVAIAAGPALAHTNGLFTALAVNALNELLDSVDRPGGLMFTPQFDVDAAAKVGAAARRGSTFEALTRELLAGGPSAPVVLFLDGANPVFASPPAWRVGEALARVPFIVSLGSFLDETSALADIILPDHSFLESWVDAVPESGSLSAVVGVAPPVMRPLHDTRAAGDVVLDIGRRLSTPIELPWQTMEEMLAATFAALPGPSAEVDAWSDAQEKGGWWGTLPAALTTRATATGSIKPVTASQPTFDGDQGQFPLHFLPYPSSAFLDGSLAHLPWLQEMPDPLTSAMWSSWVEINPATAGRLGIGPGDVVEIASAHGTLRSAAVLSPGIAPDTVAMPAGQGHRTFTRYASGRGENPVTLLAPLTEPATGALAWAATRVRVTRVGDPDGRLILFAGGMREHGEPHR